MKLSGRGGEGEVDGEGMDGNIEGRAQGVGGVGEAVGSDIDKHKAKSAPSQCLGKSEPDTTSGAGDERPRSGRRSMG